MVVIRTQATVICEKDDYLYLDDVSKKPLNKTEKPSSLCLKLMQKYTNTENGFLTDVKELVNTLFNLCEVYIL